MDVDNWVYLSYKLHNQLENMIVPPERNPKPRWNWFIYALFATYKLVEYKYIK